MPFVPPTSPKCPKCGKSVFKAEERLANNLSFHKFCFKCELCNKYLDSMSFAGHEEKIYCKQCYGRKHGPKGYGFGGGAGALTMDTGEHLGNYEGGDMSNVPQQTAPPQNLPKDGPRSPDDCPKCGYKVPLAQKVNFNGQNWHKNCLRCGKCGVPLDSVTAQSQGNDTYCKKCVATVN